MHRGPVFVKSTISLLYPSAKPSSRSPLVGEQSNTWRILLRNDRKSRHRRIKKQRRYERLAATSQLSRAAPVSSTTNSAFGQLGPAGLAEDAATFAFGTGLDPDRVSFLDRAKRGMCHSFLRGHTVCGSTASVDEIVDMTLCKWGSESGPFPPMPSLPLGLRDLVKRWVLARRGAP